MKAYLMADLWVCCHYYTSVVYSLSSSILIIISIITTYWDMLCLNQHHSWFFCKSSWAILVKFHGIVFKSHKIIPGTNMMLPLLHSQIWCTLEWKFVAVHAHNSVIPHDIISLVWDHWIPLSNHTAMYSTPRTVFVVSDFQGNLAALSFSVIWYCLCNLYGKIRA